MGALVNVLEGHCRFLRFRGVYGLYFCEGTALRTVSLGSKESPGCETYSIGMMVFLEEAGRKKNGWKFAEVPVTHREDRS